jgi:predicted  nucleic acid-binding Zn-ribbon protein
LESNRTKELRAKITNHLKKENEMHSEIAALRKELEKLRNEESQLIANKTLVIENQAREIKRLETFNQKTIDAWNDLKDDSKNKSEQEGVFAAEITIMKKQINEKNKRIDDIKEELKNKQGEIEGLKKRLLIESKKQESSTVDTSNYVNQLTQEISKSRETAARTKKEKDDLEDEKFRLHAQLSDLAHKLSLATQIPNKNQDVEELQLEIQKIQNKNSELRLKIIEHDNEKAMWKLSGTEHANEVSKLKSLMEQREQELKKNLQIVNEYEKKLNNLEKENKSLESRVGETADQREELKRKNEKIEKQREEIKELSEDNTALQAKFEELKVKVALIHLEVQQSKNSTGNMDGNTVKNNTGKQSNAQNYNFDMTGGFGNMGHQDNMVEVNNEFEMELNKNMGLEEGDNFMEMNGPNRFEEKKVQGARVTGRGGEQGAKNGEKSEFKHGKPQHGEDGKMRIQGAHRGHLDSLENYVNETTIKGGQGAGDNRRNDRRPSRDNHVENDSIEDFLAPQNGKDFRGDSRNDLRRGQKGPISSTNNFTIKHLRTTVRGKESTNWKKS